jgi:hypothetical protein
VVGAVAPRGQLFVETRRAEGIVEVVVDSVYLVYQVGLVEVARTGSVGVFRAPLVIGRGRDAQGPTGELHVVSLGLSGADPSAATHRENSFTQKTVAFLQWIPLLFHRAKFTSQLSKFCPFIARETFSFATIHALLANLMVQGLFVETK